jgi:leucyl aminopeptidase (aminopeptidase T)
VTNILDKATEIHIGTALGTDIRIPVGGIKAISSTGLITEKGGFGNLPSGESYMMPAEGKSEGIFVVDGSFAGVGKIKRPIITGKESRQNRGGKSGRQFAS